MQETKLVSQGHPIIKNVTHNSSEQVTEITKQINFTLFMQHNIRKGFKASTK